MHKKIFSRKPKEMSEEQMRDELASACVPTKASTERTSKFSAYSDYAQQFNATKGRHVPLPGSAATPANPYAGAAAAPSAQPAYPGSGPATLYGHQPAAAAYGGPAPTASPYAAASPYGGRGHSPAPSYRTYDAPAAANPSPYAAAATQYQSRFDARVNNPLSDTESVLDARRDELFGSAPARAQQEQQQQQQQQQTSAMSAPNRAALFGAAASQSDTDVVTSKYSSAFSDSTAQQAAQSRFKAKDPSQYSTDEELLYAGRTTDDNHSGNGGGAYGQEEEEQNSEDEEVEGIKTQMKFVKQEDVNLTRSALRAAAYAEESGRNALGMLGSQGERLVNVERNLQLASTQNRIASEKTRELKTLNRSMFAVHVSNPFNSKRKLQEKEEMIKANRLREQVARESTRQSAYDSQQRVMDGLGAGLNGGTGNSATAQKYKRNYKDRAKYQFEGDEEDDALEDEIEGNLDALHHSAQRLHKLALVTNDEITRQNEQLANLADNVDTLDIGVHLNSNRLMNIR